MRRPWFAMKAVLTLIAMIAVISAYWIAAFFLAEAVYDLLDWRPKPLVRQLVTANAGFLLMGISMSAIAARSRG